MAGIVSLAAGRLQPDAAAHAAEEGRRGGAGERLAWLEALKLLKQPVRARALAHRRCVDAFVLNCYFNWTGSFLGHAARGRRRRHPRQLDHAGDEHRPGRRDPDHVRPGR
ncbi:MAG: hypothetical protein M0C28_32300 [Candidatus Moduliflexus flocculans]|nr:hypothetical protein [Candidatus Moduliflexus flocculans]